MKEDIEEIRKLMAVFDEPRSSLKRIASAEETKAWTPATQRERDAFLALISPENRNALKSWYGAVSPINEVADRFRLILERAVGEPIPCASSDKST